MSPAADLETVEFADWPAAKRSDSFSNFSAGEDRLLRRLSLWDIPEKVTTTAIQVPPRPRDGIRSTVQSARSLTELGENWDGEGSQGYSLNTWRRVKKFMLTHALVSQSLFRSTLPVPVINPADRGSLDVFWRLSDRQLLVNFPADKTAPITYYGQNNAGNSTVSGRTTGREHRLDLVAWLIQK
jgi:hypothetical protein